MAAIGVDLGTTYSCVAMWKDGDVEIIANEQGNRTTPSYVAFKPTHHLIGESAKNQAAFNPRNTVFGVKRLIGRRYDDISVQMDMRHLPYNIINADGKPKIQVDSNGEKKTLAPEEISSMILYRLKEVAEAYAGTQVKDAVITVPAYFSDAQRQATRTAGTIAGLNVIRIINEPTAAALAYGVLRQLKGEKNVLIYDLGGGTFDVSILRIGEGSVFEVKATAGNTRLGGEDFDMRLVAYFARDFENTYGRSLMGNVKSVRRLRTAAERAKRCLTSASEATVELESLYEGIDYRGKVTRVMFEELCSDLFNDTLESVKKALIDAHLPKSHIHDILLVGGSTRIPKVQSMLREFFDGRPLTSAVNPDEAVAYGAAMQAAILSGKFKEKELLLIDVVPLSLGVETAHGLMYKVVERNTPIPCQSTKDITTLEDNQPALTIEVFEGERTLTKDNCLLGVFELTGIPLAPRGVPKFDIIFDIDADGILRVVALDKSTGNSNGIVIANESRLKQREIAKMVNDAKIFREQDNERKLCLESRNQLETYIYNVKSSIREHGENLEDEEVAELSEQVNIAMRWVDDNVEASKEDFKAKMTELMQKWSMHVSKMYNQNPEMYGKRRRKETDSTGPQNNDPRI